MLPSYQSMNVFSLELESFLLRDIELLVCAINIGIIRHVLAYSQSKEVPLDVHLVYIYTKTNIFGRSKQLVGSELSAKLHVSRLTTISIRMDDGDPLPLICTLFRLCCSFLMCMIRSH